MLDAALAWRPEPPLGEAMRGALDRGGRPAMDSAYRSYQEDPRHRWVETEVSLNTLGYSLLQEGRTGDALVVFTINAEAYPHSANARDSRAEALLAAGESAGAIREYQLAVKLDPVLPGAAEQLRALRRVEKAERAER